MTHLTPELTLSSDPFPGEPLLSGAADSDGPTSALHSWSQAAHQAPQRRAAPDFTLTRGE